MKKSIGRREFIKKTAQCGLAAAAGVPLLSAKTPFQAVHERTAGSPQISVVTGDDYFKGAYKAVEILGGMERWVKRGANVALLPNVQRWHPGTFTKPDIFRAVIQMVKKAGASEVNVLSWLDMKNWEATQLGSIIKEEGAELKLIPREESFYVPVKISDGSRLKNVMIMKEFYNNDVFINMPITKDHAGNKFTGTMKNLMGLNYASHNRSEFHMENWTTDSRAIHHLESCIVDLNIPVKPALNIVDATEFIITNGPMGPGQITRPQKVIAGEDRVAVDSYCTTLWDIQAEDIIQIVQAHKRGLGNMNLNQARIKELML